MHLVFISLWPLYVDWTLDAIPRPGGWSLESRRQSQRVVITGNIVSLPPVCHCPSAYNWCSSFVRFSTTAEHCLIWYVSLPSSVEAKLTIISLQRQALSYAYTVLQYHRKKWTTPLGDNASRTQVSCKLLFLLLQALFHLCSSWYLVHTHVSQYIR